MSRQSEPRGTTLLTQRQSNVSKLLMAEAAVVAHVETVHLPNAQGLVVWFGICFVGRHQQTEHPYLEDKLQPYLVIEVKF